MRMGACAERLASYKVPVKVRFTTDPIHSARFKRVRHGRRLLLKQA